MNNKTLLVHSPEFKSLLEGIKVSQFMKLSQNTESLQAEALPIALSDLNVSERLYCSFCNVGFNDKAQQRQHYKLDWHRYNLKQHLAQRKPISEEKFSLMADDVSSISGSETESDTETEQSSTDVDSKVHDDHRLSHLIARRSRILFKNSKENVISINRCLLLNKKEELFSDEYLIDLLTKLPQKSTWMIVMVGGGHFAASIIKDGEPILHKTFHSYTVRAKQGGTQSSKDNKGSHPKSAGASMRRYNEMSHTQHIQDLFKTWATDVLRCDFIFYRAVGRSNFNILFGGNNAPLLKSDPRVRSIPFTTRRPTFSEVKRVYGLLATVFVYDSSENFREVFSPPKPIKVKELSSSVEDKKDIKPGSPKRFDRSKPRPSPERHLPEIVRELAASSSSSECDNDDNDSRMQFIMEETVQETNMEDLKEFDDTVPQHMKNKKKAKRKKEKPKKPEEPEMSPELTSFWKQLHSACENSDVETLKTVLESSLETLSKDDIYTVLNQKNIQGQTILHKMSSESNGDAIWCLMLHGCDPSIKDKKSATPFDVCPDKATRNLFRRFRGDFPKMYDYTKAHIPSALNEAIEAEVAEKKREARKLKRQKEKEKKTIKEAQRQEEEEKQRFLALSDREKRALAAERRLLASSGQSNVVLARCYFCAEDITGKVPFEYDIYRFCSMPCLKAHRLKSVTKPTP